ncbi:high affinity methionine permease [Niveomyces insectorum RCEF 264]|uniref:High affinity methionine permease n=1 Tax=Niveomyces insectorum RCEF 264 TaxID=1081102 RepID=A0A162MF12_9HYPO|nr:high affinity methionine permease [Niveomyces insectorum RCEF 264]
MGWQKYAARLRALTDRDAGARPLDGVGTPNSPPGKDNNVQVNNVVTVDDQPVVESTEAGELSLEEDAHGGMGRHLGIVSTTFLIVGRIIGTGIFSTPSSITQSVGSVGAALMLWVLGLVLAYCGLLVWLEFGCMYPRSGGEKVYLEAVYKRPRFLATVIFAVQAIALGFTGTLFTHLVFLFLVSRSSSGCIVFASNIVVAAGRNPGEWEERAIAIGVIVFVTLVHTFIPHTGVKLMNVISSIKVIILLFIVVTGWVVLGGGIKSIPDPHASFRNAFAGSSHSGYFYATALFKVLNSYAGWSNAAYVLNEVRRPVHTLKIAGPLGLGICGVLYLLANVAYFAAATPREIASSGTTVAGFFFGRVFGHTAQRVLSVFVALSALGNVFTITFAQARVNQELAKEGVIPFQRFWASTWPVGSPSTGLLLHFIPSFIVIVAIPFGDAFNFILDVEGYPGSVISAFVVVGLFLLRWRQPHAPRPFRVWLPVAVFFLAGQLFLLVAPFLRPPGGKGDTSLPYWLASVIGIVVLFLGVVYWFVWRKALPRLFGYELVQQKVVLADGTVVTTFERVKKD